MYIGRKVISLAHVDNLPGRCQAGLAHPQMLSHFFLKTIRKQFAVYKTVNHKNWSLFSSESAVYA